MRRALVAAPRALVAACTVALVLAIAAPAAGAEPKLQQSPLVLDLTAAAGDVLHETIRVSAPGDALVVEVGHADLGFDTTDYQPVLIPDDAPRTTSFSTRGWFTTPEERYRVPAGGSIDVPVTITVSDNAPGGTHMGALLVRTVATDAPTAETGTQVALQAATLVFIAVDGGDPPRPRIERFEVPTRVTHGPLRPRLVVANEGDEYFRVSGTVRIRGRGTDEEIDLRADSRVVPDRSRELRAAGPDDADAERDIELGERGLATGRYEVTARLTVEPTGTVLVATRHVWVVPVWTWIAGALAVVALLALATWLLSRWLRAPVAEPSDEELDEDEDTSDDSME